MHHPSLSVARLLLVVTIVAFTSTSFSVLAKQLGAKKGSVQHQVLLQERANSSVQEDAGQGDADGKRWIKHLDPRRFSSELPSECSGRYAHHVSSEMKQLWTNKKTRQGYSALMMAIRQGWRDCAYAILDLSKGKILRKGASSTDLQLQSVGNDGATALKLAALMAREMGHELFDRIGALMLKGDPAKYPSQSFHELLSPPSTSRAIDMETGQRKWARNELMYALEGGCCHCAEKLLSEGEPLSFTTLTRKSKKHFIDQDECGVTPLVWAIEGRCFTVATMLLELAPELLSMEVGVRYNINRGHGTIETLDGEPNPVGSVAGLHSIADSKKIAYVPAGRAVANYRASPVQYMLWMHLSTSSKRMPDFVRLWDKMVSLGAISDPSMAVVYAAGACNMPLLLHELAGQVAKNIETTNKQPVTTAMSYLTADEKMPTQVRKDVMDTYGVINSRALREVVKGSCDNRLRIALKSCGASHEAILHHLHAVSAFEALPLAVTAKTIPAVFLHAEDRASAQLNKGNMGDASESSFGGSMLRMQNAVAIAEPEGASQHEEGEGNAGSVGTGTRPDVLLQLQSSRLHLNHTDPPVDGGLPLKSALKKSKATSSVAGSVSRNAVCRYHLPGDGGSSVGNRVHFNPLKTVKTYIKGSRPTISYKK